MKPSTPPARVWPQQPGAAWPRRCLLQNVARHPDQPWLAAACTDAETESNAGAVVLFDTQTGRVRSSTDMGQWAGWNENPNLMRWHPDGERLFTNVSTNGIALLHLGRLVGEALPDETRDNGVSAIWVGDQIFADTGALFIIPDGGHVIPGPGAMTFDRHLAWNAKIGAIVGRHDAELLAYDPFVQRVVYRVPCVERSTGSTLSADGQWFAHVIAGNRPQQVDIYSGDDGTLRGAVTVSLPNLQSLSWGPDGKLAIASYAEANGKRTAQHVDLVENGALVRTVDLGARRILVDEAVPEASGIAWSPSGDGIAFLLDRHDVQIHETRSGRALATFAARSAPVPTGLPDWYRGDGSYDRPGGLLWVGTTTLVRLAPHFVSFWSVDGHELGQQVVRD